MYMIWWIYLQFINREDILNVRKNNDRILHGLHIISAERYLFFTVLQYFPWQVTLPNM